MRKSKKPSISEIYDAPVEVVIAYGRLVLSIVSMIAVAVGGSEPTEHAALVLFVLRLYSVYSTAMLFVFVTSEPLRSALVLWAIAYLLWSMKIVYGGRWPGVIARALAALLVYVVFFAAVVVGLVAAAVLLG